MSPSYLGPLNKSREIYFDVFDPHPYYSIDFSLVYFGSFLLPYSSCNKEVGIAAVSLKFDTDLWVDSMMYVYSSFFLDLTSSTGLCSLMLIPLPLWKTIPVPNSHNKHFGIFSIKDNGPADWLIFL